MIRLGEQRLSQNNKLYPAKLETLRFTSASKSLIDAVAAAYGGEVKAWKGPSGPEWEVITKVKEIPVLVPPQRIDPNLEHWGNGFRDRMCDGETETIRQKPCLCAVAVAAGKPFGPRDICKPTTRMSLMLAEIPSLGTWKLESKGWNAAAELPTLAASIESAPQPIPARLEVQKREKKDFDPSKPEKDQIESKVYMVPVLHFDWITPAQAFGGELGAAARAALGAAATQRHAIEAAKVESARRKFTADEYLTLVESAEEIDDVRELWTDANADGALTDEVKKALNERAAALKQAGRTPEQQKPAAVPEPTPVPDDVVDAEVEPTADQVWALILPVAGAKGWNAEQLEHRCQQFLNKSSDDANGFELTRFLGAIESGTVA
ncbi:recombination directionality factor [Micromonosporaceae bacterium Da 78-11]